MSSLYILEPSTSGKVVLNTTVGPLDIELWARECPKACRNFVQLCLEGYYDKTIFHRVVPDFCVQGGDPTGTGSGGQSIYGTPFKDEFHQRLKFARRGLVAMANSGPNDNSSQFFFTLGPCPELDGKHTIFAKLGGDTLYNMLKLAECETDHNERPLYPHKIISTEVIKNPFPDIEPRKVNREDSLQRQQDEKKKSKSSAVKNYNLLSFGEEAEEEEEELLDIKNTIESKSKSAHDVLDDEKLSRDLAVMPNEHGDAPKKVYSDEQHKEAMDSVRGKMSAKLLEKQQLLDEKTAKEKPENDEKAIDFDDLTNEPASEETEIDKVKDEIRRMKKDLKKSKKQDSEGEKNATEDEVPETVGKAVLKSEQAKYKEAQQKLPAKKSSARQDFTLQLLEQFKSKLASSKEARTGEESVSDHSKPEGDQDIEAGSDDELDPSDVKGIDWLGHKFQAESDELRQAKDANVKVDDSFHIFDPRNPMNKRKREEAKQMSKQKRRRKSP